VTSSQQESQSSQQSTGGAREARQKANERLGQWIRRKYRLESLLGIGGMATVYAARHRNGSKVAIKIMHAEFAREEGVKVRFLREGYVANKVDHHGVVRILDDDETDAGEPFLVMELLEGETLQQLWKRRERKVPPLEALTIAEQVLDCLNPFHDLNIIHRDLKPANIFITEEGVAKLLDFGVAQLREGNEAMTRAGTALGTPSFMSPEQAMGKSDQLDGRSDIFSMGATLYAILSGQRLHQGKSDNEAFILAATQPAPSLARSAPDLPTEVIALVDRALQWDRRKRYRTAHDMRDACREVIQKLGGAPAARPQPAPAPEPAPRRPSPRQATPPPIPRAQQQNPRVSSAPVPQHTPHSGVPAPARQSTPHGGIPQQGLQRPPPQHTPHSGISSGAFTPTSGEREAQARQRSSAHPSYPHARSSQPQMPAEVRPSGPPQQKPKPPEAPEALVTIFDRLERSLPTFRQYGLDHPEGKTRFKAVYRTVVDALREMPENVRWEVHPFCFTHDKAVAWEPAPPWDIVPYNLASAGLDEVQLMPGLTEPELRSFLSAMLLDPQRDEDHDIAAALWEARFLYIRCRIRDDLAEADAAEQMRFFTETDDLEQMAREDLAEVAAMAVSTDKSGFEAAEAASAALDIDAATKAALGAQLSLEPERWRERFLDLAMDAIYDAQSREDPETVLEPIGSHSWILAKRQRFEELFETHRVLMSRLESHQNAQTYGVTDAMITRAQFTERVLVECAKAAASEKTSGTDRQLIIEGLRFVLAHIDGGPVVAMLEAADEIRASTTEESDEVYELLVQHAENNTGGRETELVEVLDELSTELAQRMLGALTASRTPQAIAILKPLLTSRNPALKCEATALLSSSPEDLAKLLGNTLASSDPSAREAAVSTMLRHNVHAAAPWLIRTIESDDFKGRDGVEQKSIFNALCKLNPSRAESVLARIVKQHGMLPDDRLDQMRIAAANALGQHASSTAPIEALEDATRRRPWNTQALRIAAGAAVESISARMRGEVAAGGRPGE
jgi:serine/threonine protein kinase